MSDVRFAGTGPDRRRRMLAADFHDAEALSNTATASSSISELTVSAFPLLSRDQVMRKIISPRLWKHNVVACLLIAFPFILGGFQFPGQDREATSRMMLAIRGLCGLELFIASQLCLLICWVRGASAVDFAGVFRAWRWMSLILLVSSLLMLTGLATPLTSQLVEWLKPFFGNIQAARPALVFVPLCATSAYVLRHVIPDMGRCRIAQSSLVIAVVLMLGRIILGIRGPSLPATSLELLEFLTCGLILSSIHLHCRYVVYVNPNPPAASKAARQVAAAPQVVHGGEIESAFPALSPTIALTPTEEDSAESETCSQVAALEPQVAADVVAESANDRSTKKTADKSAKSAKAKQRRAG